MVAEIIAVGSELLLGQIVNTNARFLSEQLSGLGISVYFQLVVGDNNGRLTQMLDSAFSRSDLVILTGGLGPTQDDMTAKCVADFLGRPLVYEPDSFENMRCIFAKTGREMTENNKKQAYVIQGSTILPNICGTAPGMMVEENGKMVALLPGPPTEMQTMFLNSLKPLLQAKSDQVICSRTLKIFGMGESAVESKVSDLVNSADPTVAPYAKEGEVELRVTAMAHTQAEAMDKIMPMVEEIQNRLPGLVYGYDEDTLPLVAVNLLLQNGLTLGVAESCTGGLLGGAITDVPGASAAFAGGCITYSNAAKEKLLGVGHDTLTQFGAVSKQTAKEMAAGAKNALGADMGIGITGIAGPQGGTEDKPVGLVYIGLAFGDKVVAKQCNFNGDRGKIRRLSVKNVLSMIIEEIKNHEKNK